MLREGITTLRGQTCLASPEESARSPGWLPMPETHKGAFERRAHIILHPCRAARLPFLPRLLGKVRERLDPVLMWIVFSLLARGRRLGEDTEWCGEGHTPRLIFLICFREFRMKDKPHISRLHLLRLTSHVKTTFFFLVFLFFKNGAL